MERGYEAVVRTEYKLFPTNPVPEEGCFHVCTLYPIYLKSEDFRYAHSACTKCGKIDPPSDTIY